MASTFDTLPGVQEKRQMALDRGVDPGIPLGVEDWRNNYAVQRFERAEFQITKFWRNFNGTPIDSEEDGGSGPFYDVNVVLDIDEMLARFTRA